MKIKDSDLQRRKITEFESIDLSDLYVRSVPEGKKKPIYAPMTVKDFIECLTKYPMDGIVEYSAGDYSASELYIHHERLETDGEYAERIATLQKLEEDRKRQKQERAENKKREREEKKIVQKQEELDTLKRLAKKYNIEINKELP